MRFSLFLLTLFPLFFIEVFSAGGGVPPGLEIGNPTGSITSSDFTLISLLSRIEQILLYGITPVVVIGMGLYIAYELLTADGDEEKNKKAWKSVAYGSIGLISISLAYAVIRIILSLSL